MAGNNGTVKHAAEAAQIAGQIAKSPDGCNTAPAPAAPPNPLLPQPPAGDPLLKLSPEAISEAFTRAGTLERDAHIDSLARYIHVVQVSIDENEKLLAQLARYNDDVCSLHAKLHRALTAAKDGDVSKLKQTIQENPNVLIRVDFNKEYMRGYEEGFAAAKARFQTSAPAQANPQVASA